MRQLKKWCDSKYVGHMLVLLICVLFCICHVMVMSVKSPDMDIFWHFKLGEDIWKTKTLSLDNPYTFLSNTEWIPHEWLYEVFLYAVLHIAGAFGFWLLYALNRLGWFFVSYKLAKPKSMILYAMMFILMEETFSMNRGNRPAEFSVYFILCIFYFYWSASKYKKIWYALLALFLANFHGGVTIILMIVHFILIVLDVCSDIYWRAFSGKTYYLNHLLDIGIFAVVCLLNPAGYKLFTNSFLVMFSPIVSFISEWRSFTFTYFTACFVILMLLSFGYGLYKSHFERRTIQKVGVLSALCLLFCVSSKAFILYFIVYFVFGFDYTYQFICDICGKLKQRWIIPERLQKLPKITHNMRLFGILYVMCIICFLTFSSNKNSLIRLNVSDSFITWANSFYSDEILTELKNNYTDDTKILTSYTYGNLLILNNMKCFVDSREWCYDEMLGECDAVDELFYITYSGAIDPEAVDAFLDKYQFDYIWTCSELRLMSYLRESDDYELIYDYKSNEVDTDKIYERYPLNRECLYKRVR